MTMDQLKTWISDSLLSFLKSTSSPNLKVIIQLSLYLCLSLRLSFYSLTIENRCSVCGDCA
jgi:hypothetical protein